MLQFHFFPSAHVHESSALWPTAAMLFWPAIDAAGTEWGVGQRWTGYSSVRSPGCRQRALRSTPAAMGERALVVETDLRYELMTHAMHTSRSRGKPSRSHARTHALATTPARRSLRTLPARDRSPPSPWLSLGAAACPPTVGLAARERAMAHGGGARVWGGAHPRQQSQHRRCRTVQRLKKTKEM
jgi:hypothetical protein